MDGSRQHEISNQSERQGAQVLANLPDFALPVLCQVHVPNAGRQAECPQLTVEHLSALALQRPQIARYGPEATEGRCKLGKGKHSGHARQPELAKRELCFPDGAPRADARTDVARTSVAQEDQVSVDLRRQAVE